MGEKRSYYEDDSRHRSSSSRSYKAARYEDARYGSRSPSRYRSRSPNRYNRHRSGSPSRSEMRRRSEERQSSSSRYGSQSPLGSRSEERRSRSVSNPLIKPLIRQNDDKLQAGTRNPGEKPFQDVESTNGVHILDGFDGIRENEGEDHGIREGAGSPGEKSSQDEENVDAVHIHDVVDGIQENETEADGIQENEGEADGRIGTDEHKKDTDDNGKTDNVQLKTEEDGMPHTPEVQDVKCLQRGGQSRLVDEFEKLHRLGEGTYGVVYKARDKRTGEVVALKKIKMDHQGMEGFPVSSLREINLLTSIRHPYIVDVREVVVGNDMDSIYMVMEYVETTLKDKLGKPNKPLKHSQVKLIMKQLLDAVAYLHDNWVLHRDLKPSNILLTPALDVKLCDFGIARRYDSPIKVYTHEVVTLWYRAPELLNSKGPIKYSTEVDMWSLGCIMAEMLLNEPLFHGTSEIEQLRLIQKMVCSKRMEKPGFIFPANKLTALRDRIIYPAAWGGREMLTETGLDLLVRLLEYDPVKRISANDALQHAWFDENPTYTENCLLD